MSHRGSRGYRFALAMAWLLAVQAGLMVGATPAAGAVTAAVVINTLLVTGDAANNPITLRVSPLDDRDIEVLDGTTSVGTFRRITIAPNGNRVRMVRDTSGVTLGLDNVERIFVRGHEGDDRITAADNLTAVGVVAINIDGGQGDRRVPIVVERTMRWDSTGYARTPTRRRRARRRRGFSPRGRRASSTPTCCSPIPGRRRTRRR